MTQVRPTPAEASDDFTAIGPLEAFPVGRIVRIEVAGRTVGVIRTVNGFRAVGNRCPHQGGPICEGIVTGTMAMSRPNEYIFEKDGEVVRCPWHGYEFELRTGRSIGGAIRGHVATYRVEVHDGEVYVSLRRTVRGASP
jgi:nitrite reductase (NADH) small subunit